MTWVLSEDSRAADSCSNVSSCSIPVLVETWRKKNLVTSIVVSVLDCDVRTWNWGTIWLSFLLVLWCQTHLNVFWFFIPTKILPLGWIGIWREPPVQRVTHDGWLRRVSPAPHTWPPVAPSLPARPDHTEPTGSSRWKSGQALAGAFRSRAEAAPPRLGLTFSK